MLTSGWMDGRARRILHYHRPDQRRERTGPYPKMMRDGGLLLLGGDYEHENNPNATLVPRLVVAIRGLGKRKSAYRFGRIDDRWCRCVDHGHGAASSDGDPCASPIHVESASSSGSRHFPPSTQYRVPRSLAPSVSLSLDDTHLCDLIFFNLSTSSLNF